MAVAIVFVAQFAAPPLAGEIRVPLPGHDAKSKTVKKRYFRPTLPERNPGRVSASISAAVAPSTTSATDVEASSAAGATSSASTAVAAQTPKAPLETASLPSDTETSPASVGDGAAGPAESTDDAASQDVDPQADSAEASSSDEVTPEPDEPEHVEEPSEPAETETAMTEPASEPEEAEQDEATASDDDSSGEPVEEPVAVTDASPPEKPTPTEAEHVEESSEPAETETATTEPVSEPEEAEKADEATKTAEDSSEDSSNEPAEAPSRDATVVIAVSPPPDEVAPAGKPEADTPEAETPTDDAEPIETAALTSPSEPLPTPAAPAGNEEPAASETGSAASDAETAETLSSDGDAEDTSPSTGTALEAEEPPADPVVAAIRAMLADVEYRKGVRAATLKAQESIYETREGAPLWMTDGGFSANAQVLIGEIGKAGDWGLDAKAFDVPDPGDRPATAEAQAAAELKLNLAILKYARFAQGGRLSPKRVSKLFDQRPSLRDAKTVLTELAVTEAPSDDLMSLHPQHEQFKRLRSALVKARARNNARDIQRIVINMERWRWMPRQLGSFHVWNNVPEFNTRVVKNGKTVYVEKTIVGQFKYATPFFSAPMRNIVFHPDWTVPPTILKEDLAPKLQSPRGFFGNANTAVLRNHGLSVKYKGEPIDADEVDWPNVNVHKYTFVQAPGPANVLGRFKFNFPNKHAIYMHDTPQPELFGETVRTLSHGCIRVRDPDRLVTLLLAKDKGWSAGQVRSLVERGTNTVISLRRPVPVHLTYFTATVGEDGRLQTFGDIYGLDNRMAPKLFANPVRFQVPAEPAIAEASSRTRDGGRSSRRTGGLGGVVTGLFGN